MFLSYATHAIAVQRYSYSDEDVFYSKQKTAPIEESKYGAIDTVWFNGVYDQSWKTVQ